ncbi:hypothetical protein PAXRUDRAFT_110219, partial [Paxillus rubicundulus Ve08.2h10]
PDVIQLTSNSSYSTVTSHTPAGSIENLGALEDSITAVEVDMLNIDQRRAYDIITWHLDRTLEGHDPPALRMILY